MREIQGRCRSRREHEHGDDADRHGGPLRGAQPLAQHEHAQQHGDDRVDEVAERGLDDVAR